MNICVHTSPSRRDEAEPRVFFVGRHRLIVAGIRERWVEHPYRYYKVTCDDGRCFVLRLDTARLTWELAGVYAGSERGPRTQLPSASATPAVQPRRWWIAFRKA